MTQAARDFDGRLAVTGPLKLVSVPRGLHVDQHTLAGEGDLLGPHQGTKLVEKAETKFFILLFLLLFVG